MDTSDCGSQKYARKRSHAEKWRRRGYVYGRVGAESLGVLCTAVQPTTGQVPAGAGRGRPTAGFIAHTSKGLIAGQIQQGKQLHSQ